MFETKPVVFDCYNVQDKVKERTLNQCYVLSF